MFLEIVIVAGFIAYVLWIIALGKAWRSAKKNEPTKEFEGSVAVLVAYRNEQHNLQILLDNLAQQSFSGPISFYLIDDHSTDDSFSIVKSQASVDSRFKALQSTGIGKKEALKYGMSQLNEEIVLTTDADVTLNKEWVSSMVKLFLDNRVEMVVGPVVFPHNQSLLSRCVEWEFASLVGTTRSFIQRKEAVMANGANLAYRKSSYVRTYHNDRQGNSPSGDDLFLLYRILKSNPNGVVTPHWDEHTVVKTEGPATVRQFWNQRVRWASKTGEKTGMASVLTALAVFSVNFTIVLLIFFHPILALFGFSVKAFIDAWFLLPVTRALNIKWSTPIHLLTEVLNLIYIPAVGFYAPFGTYSWKNRQASADGFKN